MNHYCNRSSYRQYRNRRGSLVTEAVVSAVILLTGIAIVGKSSYNFRRLWGDTRHYQLATDELCNQMQSLTNLALEDLPQKLEQIEVSAEVAAVLPEAKLNGALIDDANGRRILLKIDWKRVGTGEPLVLIGWHRDSPAQPLAPRNPQEQNVEQNQ